MKRYFNAIVAAVMLVLSFAAPVIAGPLEDSAAAYVRGDYATALRLLRSLADQGYALAQNNLGAMYAQGRGVPQDHAEASKWYRFAADQGYAVAQTNLGVAYAEGRGVRQNDAEALKWFRKAADQGHGQAQNSLGIMYAEGRSVPQDFVSAHMWFNLAAAQGEKNAAEYREKVAEGMIPAQIAEAQKLAREWKPKMERK
jgi:TPR repeat protein